MMTWALGDEHPDYGRVAAMGFTGGERYLWFVAEDGAVSMIPEAFVRDDKQTCSTNQEEE